jgi:hypothetical protein
VIRRKLEQLVFVTSVTLKLIETLEGSGGSALQTTIRRLKLRCARIVRKLELVFDKALSRHRTIQNSLPLACSLHTGPPVTTRADESP